MSFLKFFLFLAAEYVLFIWIGPALAKSPPKNQLEHKILNPIKDTLLLTGIGSVVMHFLRMPLGYVVIAFVVMFACTAYAALSGRFRRQSIAVAGAVFIACYAGVVIAYAHGFFLPS